MARMLRKTFKLVGRCHPWCGNRELEVGRATEKQAWIDQAWREACAEARAERDDRERRNMRQRRLLRAIR